MAVDGYRRAFGGWSRWVAGGGRLRAWAAGGWGWAGRAVLPTHNLLSLPL